MTAMQIIRGLSAHRGDILWIDHAEKKAGYMDDTSYVIRVQYNDAVVARTDPSLKIVETMPPQHEFIEAI